MKAFAEFLKEDDKIYRKKTLLQFGNSTDLIGSAVLMNPGSSRNTEKHCNRDIIKEFYLKNHNLLINESEIWLDYSIDSTMRCLEKIFNGWYTGQGKKLNGIIQLFNCFYYRDANLENALSNFNKDSKHLFNENHLFRDKPVYFGWGNVGKKGVLREIATQVFNEYNHIYTPIYDSNFDNNCFYHPGYINRSYSRNIITQKITREFSKLT